MAKSDLAYKNYIAKRNPSISDIRDSLINFVDNESNHEQLKFIKHINNYGTHTYTYVRQKIPYYSFIKKLPDSDIVTCLGYSIKEIKKVKEYKNIIYKIRDEENILNNCNFKIRISYPRNEGICMFTIEANYVDPNST